MGIMVLLKWFRVTSYQLRVSSFLVKLSSPKHYNLLHTQTTHHYLPLTPINPHPNHLIVLTWANGDKTLCGVEIWWTMFGLGHPRVWTFLDILLSPLLQILADFGLDLDIRGVSRNQSSSKIRNWSDKIPMRNNSTPWFGSILLTLPSKRRAMDDILSLNTTGSSIMPGRLRSEMPPDLPSRCWVTCPDPRRSTRTP